VIARYEELDASHWKKPKLLQARHNLEQATV